jgi:predicted metal-dependent peptidase
MSSTLDRVIAARVGLLLDQPFFGALALGLKLQEDPTMPTAWVDGRTMGFNPSFVAGLTHAQIVALVAHEVMHCANGHPWRRDGREFRKFNISCDKAINSLLKDANFTLPKGAYYAEGPEEGQSAEWIYARLPDDPGGQGSGQGDSTGQGEVRDAPTSGKDGKDDDGDVPTEAEWQQATKQAALAAKAQGKLPANLDRFAKEVGEARVDWRSAMRRFVQERAKADYSWSKPSSRYLSLGMYLPALESHELGVIAIAVDTSGSIDDVALAMAKAEVMAVIDETQPRAVTVYYADAAVAHVDHFERGDEIVFRPKGGGGTDFRPIFEACEEAEEAPVCLIYITDLCGTFPDETEIPTIWVTDTNDVAPIGETVRMS